MIEAVRDDANLYALIEEFFRKRFSTDNPLITEAVKRMLAAGGKRLRPRMTLLAVQACKSEIEPRHLQLAAYMELIHVATLIHDDVVDHADTRRGVNATAVDYGNRISVLAGDYLFAWIFKNVTANYPAPIPHILSATLAAICDGEVLQLRALGNLDLPISAYVEIARKKTATLFAASAECGAIAGGGSAQEITALRDYGDAYGIAFQMNDDLLDMTADEQTLGKPVGNDLRERKMTIPLILALANAQSAFRDDVARFYAGEARDPASGQGSANEAAAGRALIGQIGSQGGFVGTREQIVSYVGRAKAALEPLGASSAKAELARLAEALVPA
jgi:octaprenyl-diphosphate synthase